MRSWIIALVVLAALAGAGACTGSPESTVGSGSPPQTHPSPADDEPLLVTDLASLVTGLQLEGHQVAVERHRSWSRDIFGVRGHTVSFAGARLMAFEYPSKRAARKLQSSVDRDGYIVGDAIIDWGNQHLYRRGTVIVVYLGQRPLVIRTLEDLLGPQFAPR